MFSLGSTGQDRASSGKNDNSDRLINLLWEGQCELFAQLFGKSVQPILITGKNELTVDVNPAFENLFGYKKGELLNRDAADLIVPEAHRMEAALFIDKIKNNETMTALTQRMTKYGELIDVEVVGSPITLRNSIAGMLVMYRDRRVETKALNDLRKERAFFKQLFVNSPDPTAIVDGQDRILDFNEPFSTMFEYSLDEARGAYINDIIASEEYYEETAFYSDILITKGEPVRAETIRISKTGKAIEVELIAFPIFLDESKLGAIAIYRDISRRKEKELEIKRLAYRDTLTGAYNRLYAYENLEARIKEASDNKGKTAFIYFDLDGFKKVNDEKGHSAGDELLINIVKRFRNHFKDQVELCRVGGDEFLGIINDPHAANTVDYLTRLKNLFKEPYRVKSEDIYSALSSGYAEYPEDGLDIDALVHIADVRMYRQKRINRINRYPIRKNMTVEEILNEEQ